MHTSGLCTAPSLPHRYTLCLSLILRYLAYLHMPSLSTSHSCGCTRRGSWGERYTKTRCDAHAICRLKRFHTVSNVLLQLCRVMERKSRIPYPCSLARSHSADEMPQRGKKNTRDGEKELWRNTKRMEKKNWRGGE